jgi:hypothetical protein
MAVVPHPRRLLGKQDLRAGAMRVVVVVAVVGGTEVAALVLNSATTVGQVLQCTVGVGAGLRDLMPIARLIRPDARWLKQISSQPASQPVPSPVCCPRVSI